MKLKFFGEWFGLSFVPFVILAAIIGIPMGRMIGDLLLRTVAAPAQARAVPVRTELAMPPSDSAGSPPAAVTDPHATAPKNLAPHAPAVWSAAPAGGVAAVAGKGTLSGAAPKSASAGSDEPGVMAPGGSLVQVAAVTRAKTALGLADALKKKGYPVFVTEPKRDVYYRVEVGPYPSRHDARMIAQALEADGFQAFVITVNG